MTDLFKDMNWIIVAYLVCLVGLAGITAHLLGTAFSVAEVHDECKSSCLTAGAVDYEYANQNCFCITDGKAKPLEQMTPLCDSGTCEYKETNETSK